MPDHVAAPEDTIRHFTGALAGFFPDAPSLAEVDAALDVLLAERQRQEKMVENYYKPEIERLQKALERELAESVPAAMLTQIAAERQQQADHLAECQDKLATARNFAADWYDDEVTRLVAERQQLAEALEAIGDGELANICWCGDDWISVTDGEPLDDDFDHSDWCLRARAALAAVREPAAPPASQFPRPEMQEIGKPPEQSRESHSCVNMGREAAIDTVDLSGPWARPPAMLRSDDETLGNEQ